MLSGFSVFQTLGLDTTDFHFLEWGWFVLQFLIYLLDLFRRLGTHSVFHLFSEAVNRCRRDGFLRPHDSHDFGPVVVDITLLQLVADGVDYPIGEQPKEEVGVAVVILVVVDGSELEVGLALAIGGHPCGGRRV